MLFYRDFWHWFRILCFRTCDITIFKVCLLLLFYMILELFFKIVWLFCQIIEILRFKPSDLRLIMFTEVWPRWNWLPVNNHFLNLIHHQGTYYDDFWIWSRKYIRRTHIQFWVNNKFIKKHFASIFNQLTYFYVLNNLIRFVL